MWFRYGGTTFRSLARLRVLALAGEGLADLVEAALAARDTANYLAGLRVLALVAPATRAILLKMSVLGLWRHPLRGNSAADGLSSDFVKFTARANVPYRAF